MDTFPLKVDVNSLYHLYPVPLPISSSSLVAFSICVTSKFIPGFNLVLAFFSSPITAINPHQNKSGVEPRCDYHLLSVIFFQVLSVIKKNTFSNCCRFIAVLDFNCKFLIQNDSQLNK